MLHRGDCAESGLPFLAPSACSLLLPCRPADWLEGLLTRVRLMMNLPASEPFTIVSATGRAGRPALLCCLLSCRPGPRAPALRQAHAGLPHSSRPVCPASLWALYEIQRPPS